MKFKSSHLQVDKVKFAPDTLVQIHCAGIEVGPWATRLQDLYLAPGQAMTPADMQDRFALPYLPTEVAIVLGYPVGTKVYMGATAANRFGSGGGVQVFAEAFAELGESYTVTELSELLRYLNYTHG